MEYLLAGFLAFALSFVVIRLIGFNKKIKLNQIVHRQSDNHNFLKEFFSRNIEITKVKSQAKLRQNNNSTRVLVTDDERAYWVVDNIFFVATIVDDKPDFDNATPIDTSNMSKVELDKLLFILDNLNKGDKHERGSSGNE